MESTPPPLPTTPSSRPQPPRGNWWSRNWKWFVPTGCFTFIFFGVLFAVCITFFVFSVMKSTDVYKTAVARATNNERVTAALGTPIREGTFVGGHVNTYGDGGNSNLAIPISGPKGKATIYVVGTKSMGNWEFSKLAVQIDGGELIDLKKKGDAVEQSEENEKESAGDERVESISLAREDRGKLQSVKNFKPADNPEHIVVVLTEGNEETHIKTVWTNLNAGGATNQKLWTKELVTDENNLRADFSLSNSGGKPFPPGDYKIDVYLDDELIQTVTYKVQ